MKSVLWVVEVCEEGQWVAYAYNTCETRADARGLQNQLSAKGVLTRVIAYDRRAA